MIVKDFLKKVKEFQKKLIEHKDLYLYGNSFPRYTGGMHPVNNLDELEKQSLWLNRWWGENQPFLNKFRDSTTIQSPSTGNEWDYTNDALGLNAVAPEKSQALKKMIAEIERIIGRLKSMNPNTELNDYLNIPKIKTKHSIKEFKSKEVFIVHGHNEDKKNTVARYIDNLGLTPVVLHEQANKGRTIIEKFVDFSNVSFAIVLITYDDLGCDKEIYKSKKNLEYRARQNVIFELGFFVGKLGREKVCVLYEKDVVFPSDYKGVIYYSFQDDWKLEIAKELKASGINIETDNILNC
jgi:predicted nucleotide-binding protein